MSKQPRVRVEATGTDIFVFVDGVKVPSAGIAARRRAWNVGYWLGPGYAVFEQCRSQPRERHERRRDGAMSATCCAPACERSQWGAAPLQPIGKDPDRGLLTFAVALFAAAGRAARTVAVSRYRLS